MWLDWSSASWYFPLSLLSFTCLLPGLLICPFLKFLFPYPHLLFSSMINISSREYVWCVRVCEWKRSSNHSDSVDVPVMLFTDLCFGFCPPLLLSPFPASFLHTSAPPFTHLFSLHLDSFRPLMLHTSLNTLPLSCTLTPNLFHLLFLSALLTLL